MNYAGLTPYQLAVANGAPDVADLLEELGAIKDPLPPSFDEDLDYEDVRISFFIRASLFHFHFLFHFFTGVLASSRILKVHDAFGCIFNTSIYTISIKKKQALVRVHIRVRT